MPQLPQEFINNIKEIILDDEFDSFIKSMDTSPTLSIRINPYKEKEPVPCGDNVAWSRYGRYLNERPKFTLDPLFHAGIYYVGEASSMFIEQFFSQIIEKELSYPIKVLDLCAAPGGKSTHISSLIGVDSLLVSNEVIRSRASILTENTIKWGMGNSIVTNNDPSHFAKLTHFFDVVVVDAPCSGEGMFRKQPSSRDQWSESNVELCFARQQRILSDVWNSLKPGGFLIYSTCTFNNKENEENLKWLCDNFDVEPTHIDLPNQWGVTQTITQGIEGYHFYPHKSRGEGFFIAMLRKGDGVVKKIKKPSSKDIIIPLTKKEIQDI